MPKSKLGCRTCRRRKVKCDEELPTCQQCRKAARQCDGPFRPKFVYVGPHERHQSNAAHKPNSQLPRQCSIVPFSDSSDARTFQFFLSKVAPDLGKDLDSEFWTILLPRISHGDRAIRAAVLAISHLYEQSPCTSGQTLLQESKTAPASRWYLRSISEFSSRIGNLQCRNDYQLALLSCVLFTNIEFQLNNVLNACNLLKCGLSLISSSQRMEASSLDMSDSITKTMVQMFARQRVLLAIYGHPASHDPFQTFAETHVNESSRVEVLREVRERLYDCLNDSVLLLSAARTAEVNQLENQDCHTLCRKRDTLLRKLKLWYHEFVQQRATSLMGLTPEERLTAHIMIMNYEIAVVWVYTSLQPEIAADLHMDRFERILNLAEEVIQQIREKGLMSVKYSPELGVIAPLFLTGWKCRHPGLRRRALSLLNQGPVQEALYSAEMHAKALRAVIDIEEGDDAGSPSRERINEGRLPSEEARVRSLTVHYETWDGAKVKPALIYQQVHHLVEGKPTWVEKTMLL